jgi:hypothetical protein
MSGKKEEKTIEYEDGKYIGEISKDGKPNGKGKLFSKDGKLDYEGDWVNGVMEGEGIKYYERGTYKGQFKNNEENDEKGEFKWPCGSRYIGNWVNGAKNGKGKFIWDDGGYYEGDF